MFSSKIHTVLYLGLNPPASTHECCVIHCPLIRIIPRPLNDLAIQQAFSQLLSYTHFIFTSKTAVDLFFPTLSFFGYELQQIQHQCCLAVGKSTARSLEKKGVTVDKVALEETSEGVVKLLMDFNPPDSLQDAYFFWPHSALSRTVISDFLSEKSVHYCECVLYDTEPQIPALVPDFAQVDEIMFTSPSTVDAFLQIFKEIPQDKKLSAIGPVTESHLQKFIVSRIQLLRS